jgi:hypothetical protein
MPSFTRETRTTLRQRIGELTGYMVKGAVTSGEQRGVLMEIGKLGADDYLVGRVAYVASGTGAGQMRVVDSSLQSSGAITINPVWTTQPDATSIIEFWDQNYPPDRVNNAINLAILSVQQIAQVRKRAAPLAIAPDGSSLTLPTSLSYLASISYLTNSTPPIVSYDLSQHRDWLYEHDYSAHVVGSTLYFAPVLPSAPIADPTLVLLEGYGPPTVLATDADTCDVPSEYVVFYASFMLEAGDASGNVLDPEEHSGRAGNWLRESLVHKLNIQSNIDGNVVEIW